MGPKMTDNAKSVLDADAAATSPALVIRLNLGDPAAEMLGNVKSIVDKAEADKDARGLSADDITRAREAIAIIEAFLPKGPWAATFTTEFSDFGVLFSYRDQGALDVDWDKDPAPDTEEKFEALGKVLGDDPAPTVEVEAVPAPHGGTGLRGTGTGGGGTKVEDSKEGEK